MNNVFYVYLHRRKTDNKVFYVGKGKGKRAYSKASRSQWWNSVADKHEMTVEIVFDNLSEDDAFQIEKDTILEFRYFEHPLVNLTDGGEGMSGYKPYEEQRKRVSEKMQGREITAEHRLKISESNKGKKRTEVQRKRMSEINTGKKITAEHRLKISESNKGKKRTPEQRVTMKVTAAQVAIDCNFSEKYKGLCNPNADQNVYIFVNTSTGEKFTGTRTDFRTATGIPPQPLKGLFGKHPRLKTCFGWKLQKENDDTKTEKEAEEH